MEQDEVGMLVITKTDGVWDSYRETLMVREVHDGYQTLGYYLNGEGEGSFEGNLIGDTGDDYEVLGTEMVATPWGLLNTEVQIYTMEDGTRITCWVIQGYDYAVASMTEYTGGDVHISIVVECTLFFESPDYGDVRTVVVEDVGAGDSKTLFVMSYTEETGVVFGEEIVSVVSADGDSLTLDIGGEMSETTVEDYLWADTSGFTYVESGVKSAISGDMLMDVYQREIEGGTELIMVGHDDGILYFYDRVMMLDGSWVMASLLEGTDYY